VEKFQTVFDALKPGIYKTVDDEGSNLDQNLVGNICFTEV
jgi:hypothetical protein